MWDSLVGHPVQVFQISWWGAAMLLETPNLLCPAPLFNQCCIPQPARKLHAQSADTLQHQLPNAVTECTLWVGTHAAVHNVIVQLWQKLSGEVCIRLQNLS